MEDLVSPFEEFRQETSQEYADFWSRVAAYLIDNIIISTTSLILPIIPALLIYFIGNHAVAFLLTYFVGIYIVLFLFGWLYHCLLESSKAEATVGKKLIKIRLVNAEMKAVDFWQATTRHFISALLTGFIGGFTYITALFTDKKQGIHDMAANTFVIIDTRQDIPKFSWNVLINLALAMIGVVLLFGLFLFLVLPNKVTLEEIFKVLSK